MIQTQGIKSLKELLHRLQNESYPVLASLCPDCGSDHYLLEEVIKKVQGSCTSIFKYIKLTHSGTEKIIDELMLVKSPVLLLIEKGAIKGIYGGTIGYNQLCNAIHTSTDKKGIRN